MTARTRRAVAGAVVVAAVLAVTAVGLFVRYPMRTFELLGRAGLRGAGLRRTEMAGPRGPLVVFEGGAGPTVVLLHGANDQAGAWVRVAKPLAARHRLVIPDLPGHGDSAPREGPLAVADLQAGVDAVVALESAKAPVALVGNSLGGWLALLAAQAHPERVSHVVLVNGAAVRGQPGADITLLPRTRAEAARAMDALTGPAAPRVPGFVLDDLVRRGPASPLARLLAAPIGPSLEGRLGEIAVPVTLLWGAADRFLTVSYAEGVARALPRARLVTLDGCGHVPQRECPERFLTALQDALDHPPDGPFAPRAVGP